MANLNTKRSLLALIVDMHDVLVALGKGHSVVATAARLHLDAAGMDYSKPAPFGAVPAKRQLEGQFDG